MLKITVQTPTQALEITVEQDGEPTAKRIPTPPVKAANSDPTTKKRIPTPPVRTA